MLRQGLGTGGDRFTPETNGSIHYWWFNSRDFKLGRHFFAQAGGGRHQAFGHHHQPGARGRPGVAPATQVEVDVAQAQYQNAIKGQRSVPGKEA